MAGLRLLMWIGILLFGANVQLARADAELLAHYRLDDNWDVTHAPVNAVAGGAVGSLSTPYPGRVATPTVIPNKPNTCFGGEFAATSGPLQGASASLDLTAGGTNSVSFWMYWTGGDNQMPFGFNRYDLWLQNNSFGFNSANSDIFGVPSGSLANGWHHIAAVFTNGNVAANKLWIDGVAQSLSQRQATPDNAVAYASAGYQVSGWGNSSGFRFGGRVDEVKVYRGELTAAAVMANYTDICVVADWRMDEARWSGTLNEVKDSGGGGFHGVARLANPSTSVPTTANLTPAKSSGGESTCAYGEFDVTTAPTRTYSYVELSGFPALPSSFTFAAWIRSTNASAQHQRILVRDDADNGWGLSLADGTGQPELRFFNRNLANADTPTGDGRNPNCGVFCLDTNPVITSNEWHYIAAAIDTVGRTVTLYVFDAAGTLKARTTGGFNNPWKDGTGLVTIGGESTASGEGRQSSWHFLGNIDELRIFSGVLSQADIHAMSTRTRTCTPPPAPPPANFNCVEIGADALTGHLNTHLAGSAFKFDVVALKANGSVDTDYALSATRPVTVELVDGSGTSACVSRTPLTPAVSQTLTFAKADQPTEKGRKTSADMLVGKAYADLRCRVTDANQAPSIVGCSTDNFAVRPTALIVSASANADASGASPGALPAIKTGAGFSLSATSGVVGYSAIPKLDAGKVAAHAGAVQAGSLAGSFGNANPASGTATGNFTYSEVGYFHIGSQGVYDDTWAAIDAAASDCTPDFSNIAVAGKVGCKFGNAAATTYFGRFIPDHFLVTSTAFLPGCVAGDFSYMGQPFALSARIDALNAAGGLTQNYTGAFAHAVVNVQMENASSGTPILATRLTGVGAPAWTGGRYLFSASAFSRLAAPDGPFDLLDIGIAVADEAALPTASQPKLLVRNMDANSSTCDVDLTGLSTAASVCSATKLVAGTKVRFGRLRLANAYGSERLPLSVPWFADYWNGQTFTQNTADDCTSVAAGNIAMARYLGNLNAANLGASHLAVTPIAKGAGAIRLTPPGAGAWGSVDLLFNLGSVGAPANCPGLPSAGSSSAALSYLSGKWCGNAYDRDPVARVGFGVSKSPLILRRENY